MKKAKIPGKPGDHYPLSEHSPTGEHDYFRRRALLANLHSEFECDANCSRPGCRNQDLQIPVTVFDLIGAASLLNKPIDELYRTQYYLGILPVEGHNWISSVSIKLKKPCPYLAEDMCGIYRVRPLACVLFPEYQAVTGSLRTLVGQASFAEYRCVGSHIRVPEERVEVIRELAWMMRNEVLVSDLYLFHESPFHVDFSKLDDETIRDEPEGSVPFDPDEQERRPAISFKAREAFLARTLAKCGPLDTVEEKILHLTDERSQEGLLSHLVDRRSLKRFSRSADGDSRVFVLTHGKLKARWKSLLPPEYMFLG